MRLWLMASISLRRTSGKGNGHSFSVHRSSADFGSCSKWFERCSSRAARVVAAVRSSLNLRSGSPESGIFADRFAMALSSGGSADIFARAASASERNSFFASMGRLECQCNGNRIIIQVLEGIRTERNDWIGVILIVTCEWDKLRLAGVVFRAPGG